MEMGTLAVRQTNAALKALSVADLITIAHNPVVVPGGSNGTHFVQFEQECSGSSLSYTDLGGDNEPIETITPRFFAVATKGAKAVALVSSLDWANSNLLNYEYLRFEDSTNSNAEVFLVSGIINVTAYDGYDPFDKSAGTQIIGSVACFTGIDGQMFD